jgi:hypothetical protein
MISLSADPFSPPFPSFLPFLLWNNMRKTLDFFLMQEIFIKKS